LVDFLDAAEIEKDWFVHDYCASFRNKSACSVKISLIIGRAFS
jgi:hypothetical protein